MIQLTAMTAETVTTPQVAAIVLAAGGMTIGVGAGQMSRVDSVEIALQKAGERARGGVLASDAMSLTRLDSCRGLWEPRPSCRATG